MLYNAKTSQILGVQIIGMHAADLIQECANAMAAGTTCKQLAMMVSYCFDCIVSVVVNLVGCIADSHPSYAE